MLKLSEVKVGDKVCYRPKDSLSTGEFENGIIKEIPSFATDSSAYGYNCVRVVYNCAGEWDNYENYTAALTDVRDLEVGWGYCTKRSSLI